MFCLTSWMADGEQSHTDQLRNAGATIRELVIPVHVHRQQVIFTAHCNNMTESSH
ncbi:hypothetical protein HNQ08_005195 [Deinococcus humi]|uniref:Uncharacterized protein n=1 Tax=Deinococcus humi TaxID=662880 RepID=A0A7W8K2G7_9DEIO|nr:hypothetical protein [Deinococcus humi]